MKQVILKSCVLPIALCGAVVVIMQACSQDVAFEVSPRLTKNCVDALCVEKNVMEAVSLDFQSVPNDILFVMDDSSSMNTIISQVKSGFSTLQGSLFPSNTKMAVTYMSPDLYNSDGSIQFGSAWYPEATPTPGHLRLSTAASIAGFLSLGQQPSDISNFTLKGCDSEWFAPHEVNSLGERCLDGAVQTALYGTGVEAGVVSLEQLLTKQSLEGKRLFRDRSFVNIIFVSDTHEPGANYWGKTGALLQQRSVAQISSAITANSPGISSIKFSGVLPVPMVGNPALDGLHVIGAIPTTPEEAHVSGEDKNGIFWDYSYIPFIKNTGGVISHPLRNDWTDIAAALMDDANYTGTILVPVTYKIERLNYVKIAGSLIDQSLVTINDDGKSLNIRYVSRSDSKLEISVSYITKE